MQSYDERTLSFYTQPASMTSAGRFAPLFDALPHDAAGLAAVAQGLLVHEHLGWAYGVTLSDADRDTVHIRPVERLLECIVARDDRPLRTVRAVAHRVTARRRDRLLLRQAHPRTGVPVDLGRRAQAEVELGRRQFLVGHLEALWCKGQGERQRHRGERL